MMRVRETLPDGMNEASVVSRWICKRIKRSTQTWRHQVRSPVQRPRARPPCVSHGGGWPWHAAHGSCARCCCWRTLWPAFPPTTSSCVPSAPFRTRCHARCLDGPTSGQLTPDNVQALAQLHLSVATYAAFYVTVDVVLSLLFWGVGLLIFWRKSDEWMGRSSRCCSCSLAQ